MNYQELLDDLDAWGMVQPRAAKAIRHLLTENEQLRIQRDEARQVASSWSNEGGAEIQRLRNENERLRGALIRLRDCDWVISLPDRMDAVRDIAKAALEGRDK